MYLGDFAQIFALYIKRNWLPAEISTCSFRGADNNEIENKLEVLHWSLKQSTSVAVAVAVAVLLYHYVLHICHTGEICNLYLLNTWHQVINEEYTITVTIIK